jgi:hypothetical protein
MTERRDYVLDVAARMWDQPVRIGRPEPAGARGGYVLIPSGQAPRLMVPGESRRAARTAAEGFTSHRSGAARLRSRLLALALGSGIGQRFLRDRLIVGAAGIDEYLGDVLGQRPLIGMQIGPPRANRKPVLLLLDQGGKILGYAKIGTDPLTGRLLATEAQALADLAAHPPERVRIPALIHHDGWRDLRVLVISALPVGGGRAVPAGRLESAMRAVAATGPGRARPAGQWEYLRSLVAALAGLGASGAALGADLAQLIDSHADLMIPAGAWHGDLTVWNCALSSTGDVLIWDWERYERDVPLGYDALHHHLQTTLSSRPAEPGDVAALISRAPALLAGFGVAPDAAAVIALTYLADLGRRYLADGQQRAGHRLGRVDQWLVPGVHACTERIAPMVGRA